MQNVPLLNPEGEVATLSDGPRAKRKNRQHQVFPDGPGSDGPFLPKSKFPLPPATPSLPLLLLKPEAQGTSE